MLTPAQYKALKAWPDGGPMTLLKHNDHGYAWMSIPSGNVCSCETMDALLYRGGFITRERDTAYKVQPACDDAIREYEEAHSEDI